MVSSILLALALAVVPQAFAGQGTAQLDMYSFHAGYDLKMDGDVISGSIHGLGGMSGTVMLAKKDGKWSGRLGMYQIRGSAPVQTSSDKFRVRMTVVPGGLHYFNMKMKADEMQLNAMLSNGMSVQSHMSFKKSEMSTSNPFISMNVKKRSDGMYKGMTQIRTYYGWDTSMTDLKVSGDLMPEMLAKNDHALYVLLYVLPFNLYK
ncbi:MAG TPA: hypothetical protein VFV50_17020 [Bdellovibrionales bacterium]|nr:hypothetical protein [Bdellovibrionales bacterium]